MNSSMVSLGVAPRSALMRGKIGSTRPMPMNEIAQAKAIAQTAVGCRRSEVVGFVVFVGVPSFGC
ncbi:hypothetical protein GCM10020360_20160 [Nonlabens tegetincola]